MKNQTLEFDAFDTALSELLQGEEMPAPDFAARVMAQVRETAQQPKAVRRARRSTWTTVAACAAVLVLCAPFLGGMLSNNRPADKAADGAAPAEIARDDAMVAMDSTAADDGDAPGNGYGYSNKTADGDGFTPRESERLDGEMQQTTEPAEATSETATTAGGEQQTNGSAETLTVVILEEEVFREASRWLLDQGYPYEDGYHLTAADVALLNAQFPDLELEEMDCILQGAQ